MIGLIIALGAILALGGFIGERWYEALRHRWQTEGFVRGYQCAVDDGWMDIYTQQGLYEQLKAEENAS